MGGMLAQMNCEVYLVFVSSKSKIWNYQKEILTHDPKGRYNQLLVVLTVNPKDEYLMGIPWEDSLLIN